MDGESSCDSDVSESWSLIDLNLNEQLADVPNSSDNIPSEATPKTAIKNENDCESEKKIPAENFELMEFGDNLNQMNDSQTNLSSLIDNPKKEAPFEPFQAFMFLDEAKRVEELEVGKVDDEENVKFNFNDVDILEGEHKSKDTDFDTDGISVISEAEYNETRYYSNENDKNWEEELQTEYLSNAFEKNNPTVIRKRRKRVKLYSDSSDDNLNSDLVAPERKYSDSYSANQTDSSDEMQVSASAARPVYRHYRNNVANTVLSLAMGVIFAGVACIALGHFLGVHDAEQTAGEMMEALKRLQMENIQLQSRLTHLSRVFFTREIHQAKPDVTENNAVVHNCINSDLNQQIYKTEDIEKDNNGKFDSTIENDFISLQKLENLINRRDLLKNNFGMEMQVILNQIHDHMAFLSNISKDNPKLKRFQELDSKIAGYVNNLAQTPPKSELGLQTVLKRLKKFSEKLNHKLCKNFWNLITQSVKLNCEIKAKIKQENGQNLNLFQWFPVNEDNQYPIMKLNSVTSNESPAMYIFPQPKEYYENPEANVINQNEALSSDVEISEDNDVVIEEEPELNVEGLELNVKKTNSLILPSPQIDNFSLVNKSEAVAMEPNQGIVSEHIRNNKTRYNGYNKENKKDNRRKDEKNKRFDKSSDLKKDRKEKYKFDDAKKSKYGKENSNREKYNRRIYKEYSKKKKFEDKKKIFEKEYKQKESKPSEDKKSKSNKNTQKSKYNKKNSKKNFSKTSDNYSENKNKKYNNKKDRVLYDKNPNSKQYAQAGFGKEHKCGSNCYNISGDWIYKMAKGREQCRRYRRLSDWQFDRARSRETLRDLDENWFIERSAARENNRDGARWYFKRHDARNHQRRGFSPETFSWI